MQLKALTNSVRGKSVYVSMGLIVLCSLGGFIFNELWLLNLCAHCRLAYILVSVVFLAFFAYRRNTVGLVVALAAAAINIAAVMPYLVATRAPATSGPSGETTIKILQMNAWFLNKNYPAVYHFIREQAPDVVAVEEFSEEANKEFARLGMWKDFPFHETANNNYQSSEIALFAKKQPKLVRKVFAYGERKDPSILASIDYGGKPVTVIVMHPRPPAAPGLLKRQIDQLQKVASIRGTMDQLVIVAGDLNTTPWASPFSSFTKAMRVRDSRLGFGLQSTYPTWMPFLPIDFVLCSPQIKVRKFEVLTGSGSDHRSLLTELVLP